jgi:hypothetical protein
VPDLGYALKDIDQTAITEEAKDKKKKKEQDLNPKEKNEKWKRRGLFNCTISLRSDLSRSRSALPVISFSMKVSTYTL